MRCIRLSMVCALNTVYILYQNCMTYMWGTHKFVTNSRNNEENIRVRLLHHTLSPAIGVCGSGGGSW